MSLLANAGAAFGGYFADGGNSPSDIDPTTGKGPEWGEAAPVGLLVIVLMCVAVYFLVKSLNRNLKKVPESFATVGAPDPASSATPNGVAVVPSPAADAKSDADPGAAVPPVPPQ